MNDTTPEVEALLRAMYRDRSPGTRLRMATAEFAAAKRLVLAGLGMAGQSMSDVERRRALLARLYGEELTVTQRNAIAARVTRHTRAESGSPAGMP